MSPELGLTGIPVDENYVGGITPDENFVLCNV